MIVYNVTVKIENNIQSAWIEWVGNVFIPKVLNTKMFYDFKLLRLLNDTDEDGITYAIQFYAETLDDFEDFLNNHANDLIGEHKQKFLHQHVAFMTVLESIELL